MFCDSTESGSGGGAGEAYAHRSVLCAEVVDALRPAPGRLLVDATLGGGGHAARLLEAGARVIGIDRDADALEAAGVRLAASGHGARARLIRGNFADLPGVLASAGVRDRVDGVLLDLGVSSWQLDTPGRGFSFRHDGRLDMRMDRRGGVTAEDIVNSWDTADLTALFRELGEERQASRIARAIAGRRTESPIRTTGELAGLIERAVGPRGPRHPGTRVFQALRMAVNAELDALGAVLGVLPALLRPGGRVAVITFHSIEDRLVKRDFQRRARAEDDDPTWPAPRPNPGHVYRLPTRRPILPSRREIEENPRSRSAKLRVAERI